MLWLLLIALPLEIDVAQEPDLGERIVATVAGEPIFASEVERELRRAVGQRALEPPAMAALRAKTLEQLIDRQLILAYLDRRQAGASEQEIDVALSRVEKQLAVQNQTLAAFLRSAEMGPREYRRVLAWQIGWQRYLTRFLTDENLQRYFAQHRHEFDGTTIRVAHILWKVDPPDDVAALDQALAVAAAVRQKIASGELAFAAAAREYSAAPTAATGGDIGFIGRRGPMPEPFSQAAFALEIGAISQPVVTPFGVHLLNCLEIKPGERTWQQARGELEPAVVRYLFQWTADQQRPLSQIEFSAAASTD